METLANLELAQLDAVQWLKSLPGASVDLLITDPPYESLEKHRAIGTTTRLKVSAGSSNPWFTVFPNARFAELFSEVYRVLKQSSHFYLMCDQETAFIAKPIAEAAGFKFWKPLIWDKCTIGMGYHYRARYEFVLFFEKGKRKLNDLGIADVLTAPRVRGGYPAEKPVALSETLILQSSSAGDIVADPFMGSGSVGVAALKLSRRFLGNDVSDSALAHSRARFTQVGGQEGPLIPAVSADSPGQRRLALVLP
ncbi:MAG TPA: site-specific DNA-methyltransferase [Polyangiaceae bacterium]